MNASRRGIEAWFRTPPRRRDARAFTLLELLLASLASAMILLAVYGIFSQAIHLRDSATRRVRDSRLRARAERIIRGDLRNALVSGGVLAAVLAGDSASPNKAMASVATASNIPGYLRFTTTTGRNDANGLHGDVQQVEYYVAHDPAATDPNASGRLMRAVTRDLLNTSGLSSASSSSSSSSAASSGSTAGGAGVSDETPVLGGVQSFQVAFYDGSNWQASWDFSGLAVKANDAATTTTGTTATAGTQIVSGQTSLPDAVRIDIQQAPAVANGPLPPPLEILIPWTTQPYAAATPATASGL